MYFTVSDEKFKVRLHGATYNGETDIWTFNMTGSFIASRKGRGFILYDIEPRRDGAPVLIYREIEAGMNLSGIIRHNIGRFFKW